MNIHFGFRENYKATSNNEFSRPRSSAAHRKRSALRAGTNLQDKKPKQTSSLWPENHKRVTKMAKTRKELRKQYEQLKKRLHEGDTLDPRAQMRLQYLSKKFPTTAQKNQKHQKRQKRLADAAKRLADAEERFAENSRSRAVAVGAEEARRVRMLPVGATHNGASDSPTFTDAARSSDYTQQWDFKGWGRNG